MKTLTAKQAKDRLAVYERDVFNPAMAFLRTMNRDDTPLRLDTALYRLENGLFLAHDELRRVAVDLGEETPA